MTRFQELNLRGISKTTRDSFLSLLLFQLSILFITLLASYVGAFYLEKPLDIFLLYVANDPGYVAPGSSDNPILGVHRFGDFLQMLSYSKLDNPYSTNLDYPSTYGPLAYYFFKLFAGFSPLFGILLLSGLTTAILIWVVWKLLSNFYVVEKMIFIVIFLLLSKPFLLTLDRGNIQGLVIGLTAVFVLQPFKSKVWLGDIALSIAILFKLYPAILLLKYVRTGQLKRAFLITASTGLAGIILLASQTNSTIWDAVQGLLKGMSVQSQSALSGLSGTSWINRFFSLVFGSDYVMNSAPIRMVSLVLTIAIITWLWISASKLSPMKQNVLLLAIPSILVPVSWNYNAIWVTLGIALLLNSQRETGEVSKIDNLWLYPLAFAIAVVPWVLVSPNFVNVGISELIFFPLIVGLITYWTISDSKKIL